MRPWACVIRVRVRVNIRVRVRVAWACAHIASDGSFLQNSGHVLGEASIEVRVKVRVKGKGPPSR